MALSKRLTAGTALGGTLVGALPVILQVGSSEPNMAHAKAVTSPEEPSHTHVIEHPEPIVIDTGTAQAVKSSLHPKLRPADLMEKHSAAQKGTESAVSSSLLPQLRPFTLGASDLFKEIYEPEASQELVARMNATLGGENYGAVLNWDGITLSDYSKAELLWLKFELDSLEHHPDERVSFIDARELAEEGTLEQPNTTKEELIKELREDYTKSHLKSRPKEDGSHVAVSNYGRNDDTLSFGHFFTPSVMFSADEVQHRNAIADDYIKRHENCHGIDPLTYDGTKDIFQVTPSSDFHAGVDMKGSPVSLQKNYRHYMLEQFADACATLEYVLEGNAEALEHMERASYYRDAGTFNNLARKADQADLRDKALADASDDELRAAFLTRVSKEDNSYFIHHDTGPSIRHMLHVSSRLSATDRAVLQADTARFVEYVKEQIQESSFTPDEYMALTDDVIDLAQGRHKDVSEPMKDIITRHYEGEKAIIEDQFKLPYGSINALREAAPQATQTQMHEYLAIHMAENTQGTFKGMIPAGVETVPSQMLDQLDQPDLLLYANSYAIMRSTGEWGSLNTFDPHLVEDLQDLRGIAHHKASFHSRNSGHITQEAGPAIAQIARGEDPEFETFLQELNEGSLDR